jgi:acetolactate synthase-1/2/3 large subunit
MPTGAEMIVQALQSADVEVVFGLPGVHNLPLWEALRDSGIRLVGVRHEQAAAYAADGYSRATGRVGVALTTTGPGAANTLGAVGEAWASRSRVLVIATDIPSALRRPGEYRGVLHETSHQAGMFAPVVDAIFSVPEHIEAALAAAVDGPVYLECPTDALSSDTRDEVVTGTVPTPAARPGGAPDTEPLTGTVPVTEVQRPLLWVGGGARDWRDEVVALAERLGAPVVETYQGRGVMPCDHPLRVGFPPHVEPVGRLWDEADLVIAIGDALDGMVTQNFLQPQPPRLITVGRTTVNYTVDAHVSRLSQLEVEPGEPYADLHALHSEACARLDERALEFLDALSFALPDDANVVADMCIPGYWIGGFYSFPEPRKLAYPVGWGTLGFAFPAALGTALAGTGPTVSISGDGGFLFACGELATVAQEQIPLTAVIVDDGGYGMLRYDQDLAGHERFGVDLRTPDFAALAESFGIRAQTVDGLDQEFGAALAEHVADPAPSVLVARTPEPLVPPPTTSPNWYRRKRTH